MRKSVFENRSILFTNSEQPCENSLVAANKRSKRQMDNFECRAFLIASRTVNTNPKCS